MLSLSVSTQLTLEQSLSLYQMFGDTAGDIPLYSLHRFRSVVKKRKLSLTKQQGTLFAQELIEANNEYQSETGNKWYCITARNLENAMDRYRQSIENALTAGGFHIMSKRGVVENFLFVAGDVGSIPVIQQWFIDNHNDLIYDKDGNVPWPVIQYLRSRMTAWKAGIGNPFGAQIEDMVLEVARDSGIVADEPTDAWEQMGGKLFTKSAADR